MSSSVSLNTIGCIIVSLLEKPKGEEVLTNALVVNIFEVNKLVIENINFYLKISHLVFNIVN